MFNSMTDLVNEVIISLTVLRNYIDEHNEEEIENELNSAATTYSELQRTVDIEDTESVQIFDRHKKILEEYYEKGIEYLINNSDEVIKQLNKIIDELKEHVENRIA